MLLFGKRSFEVGERKVLHTFLDRVKPVSVPSQDLARDWLAVAGQIEQALADAGSPAAEAGAAVTDAAALLFLQGQGDASGAARLAAAIEEAARCCDGRKLQVAVPEGFAWYALDPAAYAITAERWLAAQRNGTGRCTVIGLRSIGTALSAVVAARLRRTGLSVDRMTVRPTGPPFARLAALPARGFEGACIVVDEGPGLSGSSMASVATELERRGVPPDRIVLFPGHANGPGQQGSPEVRRWWSSGRVWVTDGMTALRNDLAALAEAALGETVTLDTAVPRQDLLELPHLVARGSSGAALRFWFGGFAAVDDALTTRAQRIAAVQMARAAAGLAMPVTVTHAGWVGQLEPAGCRLHEPEPTLCAVRDSIAPVLTLAARDGPAGDGIGRIVEAIRVWREERAPDLSLAGLSDAAASAAAAEETRVYGDGDLGPAGFRRTDEGRLMKITPGGHDCGHGWAGPQSILWDIAGTEVEWQLEPALARALIRQSTPHPPSPATMCLYRAGYCCEHLAVALFHGAAQRANAYERRLRHELAVMEQL